MEDRIAFDLCGSQPTLRATGTSSQDESVILARNFLIREVFSYGIRGEVRWAEKVQRSRRGNLGVSQGLAV